MKKIIFTILVTLSLFGCKRTPDSVVIPANDILNVCVHKYDHDADVSYFSSQAQETITPSNNVKQLQIVDINNEHHMINEFEIENYICEQRYNNFNKEIK